HLYSGDLRDRVPLVRRLERAGEQRVFFDRLRREARIHAARAEETQLADPEPVCGVDHVDLNLQVVADELGRIRIVREDAADLRRGEKDVFRPLGGEETLDGGGVAQVELGARADHDVRETAAHGRAVQRRAHEAPMPRDVDLRVPIHSWYRFTR